MLGSGHIEILCVRSYSSCIISFEAGMMTIEAKERVEMTEHYFLFGHPFRKGACWCWLVHRAERMMMEETKKF